MSIELSFFDDVYGYFICLAPNKQDILYIEEEKCWRWEYCWDGQQNRPIKNYYEPQSSEQYESYSFRQIFYEISNWRKYHFHDTGDQSPIKKNVNVNDNRFFRQDGSNLPAYLLLLKKNYPQSYLLICNTIKQVTPFLKDFRLETLMLHKDRLRLEWVHNFSDKYFDVSSLSDGTLRFICLATLLLQPPTLRPSMILLDEPELGLHPYAITLLASMIKSAAVDTQVIISTQSSLLLDHFEPEDILVTELENGGTTIKRLDSDALDQWLEDYSLGQLWEKNYLGGRPRHG
jgi:predicted ATPase